MRSLLKYLLIVLLVDCEHRMLDSLPSAVEVIFRQYKVVPSIVSKAPEHYMIVVYGNQTHAMLGNRLTRSQVVSAPSVNFYAFPDQYYTVMLVGPNKLSSKCPTYTQQLHWLVVNIPGDKITSGDCISKYIPPNPKYRTSSNRFTFLVFRQQKGKLNCNIFMDSWSAINGDCFNIRDFSQQFNLYLLAGNLFFID